MSLPAGLSGPRSSDQGVTRFAVTPGDLPPLIDARVRILTDPVADAFASQLAFLSDYQRELQRIERDATATSAQIRERIRELVYNRTVAVNQMLNPKNWTERIAEIDKVRAGAYRLVTRVVVTKIVDETTATIANNVEEGRKAALEQQKILQEFRDLNAQGKGAAPPFGSPPLAALAARRVGT